MSPLVRPAGLLVLAAAVVVTVGPAGTAPAADKEQIQAALDKGVAFLKARAAGMAPAGGVPLGATGHGVGPAALVGVALLSADVPPADPGVQAIAKAVRQAAVRVPADHQTYQLALCLLFLDKLGEPEDVPLIQAVAVQLLVGQTTSGGWDYTCVEDPTMDSTLQAGLRDRKLTPGTKDEKGNPQLHPAVAAYYQQIAGRTKRRDIGDNSNTQFGVLAVWAARKHGVPVEPALNAVVKRFFGSQMADGGWGYSETGGNAGSRASMTCAGLLALATHVARKEEEWAAAVARKDEKKAPKEAGKPGDGFFTPAGKAEKKDRRPADPVDERVGVALRSLGEAFARAAQGAGGQAARLDDFYFLWSVERVGVLYDVAKIGNVDWYAVGADFLVRNQRPDGSWSIGAYQHEVNTAFAVLFLAKANLAGDLTRKMKGAGVVELSTGGPPGGAERAARPMPLGPVPARPPEAADPTAPKLDLPPEDEATRLGDAVAGRGGDEFEAGLKQLTDAEGPAYTKALLRVVGRTDGDRRRQARDALAERLTRMSAKTLRAMMVFNDAELRRGAVLAAAMQEDPKTDYVPDLIARVAEDEEDLVVRAARAGLKALTGSDKDFGPADGASKAERKAAADAWRQFWAGKKK